MNRRKVLSWSVLIVVSLILLSVLNWWYQNGRVEITLDPGTGSDTVTYTFTKQGGKQKSIQQKAGSPASFTLRKGDYDVLVQSPEGNFFSVISVKGWYNKTKLTAGLVKEAGVEFIANGASNCLAVPGGRILSYPCEGSVSEIKLHEPPSGTSPPYARRILVPILGDFSEIVDSSTPASTAIEGTVGENLVLINMTRDTASGHFIYRLVGENNRFVDPQAVAYLQSLKGTTKYTALPYKSGFIVYSPGLNEFKYFAGPQDKSSDVSGYNAAETDLPLSGVSIKDDQIVVLHSNAYAGNKEKPRSELVFGTDSTNNRVVLKKAYSSARVCAENYLCLTGSQGMDVYRFSGGKLEFQYSVASAHSTFQTNDTLYLETDEALIVFDAVNRQGRVVYTKGSYDILSVQTVASQPILVITDSSANRFALSLDLESQNDNIDKRVASLQANSEIEAVLPYRNQIFITPKTGAPTYNQTERAFIRSKAQLEAASDRVNNAVKAAEIDTSKYTIINTVRY